MRNKMLNGKFLLLMIDLKDNLINKDNQDNKGIINQEKETIIISKRKTIIIDGNRVLLGVVS